jgi:hypothetical protein
LWEREEEEEEEEEEEIEYSVIPAHRNCEIETANNNTDMYLYYTA